MQLALPLQAKREKRSASSWDLMRGFGDVSEAGVYVNPVLAENLSAAFASVQLVAQSLATLPVYVYRRQGNSRFEDPQHPVAKLFAGDVNAHQGVADFIEQMQAAVLWNGNGYSEIVRDGQGRPVELIPLTNSQVSVVRFPGTRRIAYDVSDLENGRTRRLLMEEMAPWASKWEQTISRLLFSEVDRQTHEVQINMDDLLRGDPLTRAQTWRVYRELGVVNANEIRAEEGWNPRTDRDAEVFFAPLNLQSEQTAQPKE
jgi:phage portal protein BeeE